MGTNEQAHDDGSAPFLASRSLMVVGGSSRVDKVSERSVNAIATDVEVKSSELLKNGIHLLMSRECIEGTI